MNGKKRSRLPDETQQRNRNTRRSLPKSLMLLIFAVVMFTDVSQATAWWNEEWGYRKRITFDTTPTGSDIKENLMEFPALIRLHSGNFNFSACKPNGEDIRLVAGDDRTMLKYHIEMFDPLEQVAFIWVKLNQLSGASQQEHIWLYYGNQNAASGPDPAGTYDVNQVGVYHFNEINSPPKDASARQNNPSYFSGGQGLPGVIGNGLSFNGANDKIVITATPTLDFSKGFTFSAWIRLSSPVADGYIFAREEGEKALIIKVDQTTLSCRIQTDAQKVFAADKVIDISLNSWHHIAVTMAPQGRGSLFFDGLPVSGTDFTGELPAMKTDIALGASFGENHFF